MKLEYVFFTFFSDPINEEQGTPSGGAGYTIRRSRAHHQEEQGTPSGEAGHTIYTGLTEHVRGLKEKHEENPLYRHVQMSHRN